MIRLFIFLILFFSSPTFSKDHTYADCILENLKNVSSDVAAQSELVKKYNIGVVFKDRDVTDFSNKVIELHKEKSMFKKLKNNCHLSIEKLNNSAISNQLTSIYE